MATLEPDARLRDVSATPAREDELELFQFAQAVTDRVCGPGTYVRVNHFDPSKGETCVWDTMPMRLPIAAAPEREEEPFEPWNDESVLSRFGPAPPDSPIQQQPWDDSDGGTDDGGGSSDDCDASDVPYDE